MSKPHLNVGRNPRREWRAGEPVIVTHGKVKEATEIFLAHGAEACRQFLGPQFQILSSRVMARAQYLERCTKRFTEAA